MKFWVSLNLESDKSTKTRFAFDDAVRDSHASAKGGKEKDDLDGVDIVGDDNELGLLAKVDKLRDDEKRDMWV